MIAEDGDFVMPGTKIGIIEQFLPGEGTYENEGNITASILGIVKINQIMKTITVKPVSGKPSLLKKGDTIYGQITDMKNQRVTVKIDSQKNNSRSLALPYIASIHISKVKNGYIKQLTDAFRIGDIIEAKVDKIIGDNMDLSTIEPEYGVIKAMCTSCRGYMHTTEKKNEVQCSRCNKKEKRELSINYVNK